MDNTLSSITDFLIKILGPFAIPIILIIFILLNPEKTNIWFSWFHIHIFRRFFRASQRKSVSLELQGIINEFMISLNKKIPNILIYGIRIKWIHKEETTRKAFIKNNQVVVVLKSYDEQDINFVTAVMLYLPRALIPYARININKKPSRAIDFTYAKKIIRERKSVPTLDYFLNEVLYPEIEKDDELKNYCAIMDNFDNTGILTSILMNELIILSRKLNLTVPSKQVIHETRDFITFLSKFAFRKREEKVRLEFIRRHIRIGITPIAIKEKFRTRGVKPYKEAIERNIKQGIDKNYIIASGVENINAARKVSMSFKNLDKVTNIKEIKYRRAFFDGKQTVAITIIVSIK